jgi:speckle-type POZ protein
MPNPVCAASDADHSHSASAIVAVAVTGNHLLHVEGYSRTKEVPNGEFIKSRPFNVGGCSWYILYYPNGVRSECAEYISVSLALSGSVNQPVKAQAKFILLDQASKLVPPHTRTTSLTEYSCNTLIFGKFGFY